MTVNWGGISIDRRGAGVGIDYAGETFVEDLGIGLPINNGWRWSFDGSLKLVDEGRGAGKDRLGEYSYVTLIYTAPGLLDDMPLIQQELRTYAPPGPSGQLLIETKVLEEIRGTYLEDSFYSTTFNSPVLLLPKDLNFLAYTWGLMGAESSRDGGHFPEAVAGTGLQNIPSKLRTAGYSPREDLHNTAEKPFCPLVLYNDTGRTLVISPFNHFLISPLRTIETPSGQGVARGFHGSVDVLPKGTTSRTALVFGDGVVETMAKWGDWLLKVGEKSRRLPTDNPLLGGIGFWNCFGGYYTELFRKVDERVLKELAAHFSEEDIPVSYFGLDLWYNYGQVGFARNYREDQRKYPRGLGPVYEETGVPYLLHMSAFESPNDYLDHYEFAVDQDSSYPTQRKFYEDLAQEFKVRGAIGIWPDFLRTQLQNSKTLRNHIGEADRWFDDLAGAFGDQDMVMMMCMPTVGHYLASTRHQNIVAVRTHSDYLNHQKNQVEALRHTGQIRNFLPFQQSVRHNVLVSLLAHSLGLCPSFDVFLTNRTHPEGFSEPNAESEALLRAMSAGVVAVGDKAGFIDKEIIGKLCFPDGRTSRPDHPPLPVVGTLQSEVLAFYTTTTVSAWKWIYLALFNIGEARARYELDISEIDGGNDGRAIYDYFAGKVTHSNEVEGDLEPGQGHYYVVMPQVGWAGFLGFPDKYITVSSRQVAGIEATDLELTVNFRLPFSSSGIRGANSAGEGVVSPASGGDSASGRSYTVALQTSSEVDVRGDGAEIRGVGAKGELVYIEFKATSEEPSLRLAR